MQLPLVLLAALLALAAMTAADRSYSERDFDMLKRLSQPPKLSKRAPVLAELRKRVRCNNGYEQCPGVRYCCQAGLTCFDDGTCGNVENMICQKGETPCGKGTSAGCCPFKTSCVGDGKCVLTSGDVVRQLAVVRGVGVGMAAVAMVGLM